MLNEMCLLPGTLDVYNHAEHCHVFCVPCDKRRPPKQIELAMFKLYCEKQCIVHFILCVMVFVQKVEVCDEEKFTPSKIQITW